MVCWKSNKVELIFFKASFDLLILYKNYEKKAYILIQNMIE